MNILAVNTNNKIFISLSDIQHKTTTTYPLLKMNQILFIYLFISLVHLTDTEK